MQNTTTSWTADVTGHLVMFGMRDPRPLAEYASAVDPVIPGGKAP